MSLVHLIRHPQLGLAAGICYGSSDVPLPEIPAESAAMLRAKLPPDTRIVSSPLARCLAFARLLAADPAKLVVDARLREMHFGDWEMQSFSSIARQALDAWAAAPWGFVPPGGESADTMRERVTDALREWLRNAPESIAFVSHGGPLRVILGALLRLPQTEWLDLACDCGSLTRLRLHAGGPFVEVRNLSAPYAEFDIANRMDAALE